MGFISQGWVLILISELTKVKKGANEN